MNLQVVENKLVPVYKNENEEKLVDARELHDYLEVSTRFNDWFARKSESLNLKEGIHFYSKMSKTFGRPQTNYFLTIDTAKHMSMTEKNEKGHQTRDYFIEVEKKAIQMVQQQFQQPASSAQLLLMYAQQFVDMEQKVNQVQQAQNNHSQQLQKVQTQINQMTQNPLKQDGEYTAKGVAKILGLYTQPIDDSKPRQHERAVFNLAREIGIVVDLPNNDSHYEDNCTRLVYNTLGGSYNTAVNFKEDAVDKLDKFLTNHIHEFEVLTPIKKGPNAGMYKRKLALTKGNSFLKNVDEEYYQQYLQRRAKHGL